MVLTILRHGTDLRITRSGVHLTSCSQNLRTVQPWVRNDRRTRLSRAWLVSILFCQKAVLVRGRYLHFVQPCQKQPSTKTAIDRKSTRLNSSHLGISYA